MYILGIHDGHNSGATLLKDGYIVASVSEERLTRVKNEVGYPTKSIKEVLRIANCSSDQLSSVVYSSEYMHSEDRLRHPEKWYHVGINEQKKEEKTTAEDFKNNFEIQKDRRIKKVVEHIQIDAEKISFVEHHLAHGAAAYYGSKFDFSEPVLILTCDGAGDGMSATVSIGDKTSIKRISSTHRDASIGKIYSRVTYALGLTPWEHEYKVMGLAPYAYQKNASKISKLFKELVCIGEDKMSFKVAGDIKSNYIYEFLREKLERKRFDEVSAAVQIFTEEILCEWVENCVKETGIKKVVFGGGVFMNVKANMKISQLDCIDEMFVFPSCGDESLPFGAVWHEYYSMKERESSSMHEIKKCYLDNVYLGAEFSPSQIEVAIDKMIDLSVCSVEECAEIEEVIAKRLADNKIVARMAGKMEWGARALGNRSILANPKRWENVEKINSMIKMRDFWMPFAPSMLVEKTKEYLINPKNLYSQYMMFAFETTSSSETHLSAAVHPRDRTARAQFVDNKTNPSYHKLISKFYEITGQGAVLNTSFNLHGYPLVNSPEDAIDVFLRSGLDCLAIENYLITKK